MLSGASTEWPSINVDVAKRIFNLYKFIFLDISFYDV